MSYYVSKEDFYRAYLESREAGKITDELARYFDRTVRGLAQRGNFRNYPDIDDMIGDAMLRLCQVWQRFDADNYTGVHAWVSQVAYFVFIARIEKMKKELADREKWEALWQ